MGNGGGSDDFGIPVHVIKKTGKEQLRISINEFHGFKYIDIRSFFLLENDYKPSKKGITLKTDLYPELLQGIVELGEALGYTEKDINGD